MVKSPGVPRESPLAAAARARGIPIWSEVELGSRLLPGTRSSASPGTNGKTTTTRAARRDVPAAGAPRRVAGNVGAAAHERRAPSSQDAWVVCELSSFQLEDITRSPARRRPAQPRARPSRPARDVRGLSRREAAHLRARPSDTRRAARVRASRTRASSSPPTTRCRRSRCIPGAHNRENAAAATAAARAAGIADEAIAEALRTFAGVAAPARARGRARRRSLRQRLEGDEHRRRAPRRSPRTTRRCRLILGGSLQGRDFDELAAELPANVALDPPDRRGDRRARRRARRAPGVPYARAATSRTAVARAAARRAAGRRRPALAGVRELRPVPRTSSSAARSSGGSCEELA